MLHRIFFINTPEATKYKRVSVRQSERERVCQHGSIIIIIMNNTVVLNASLVHVLAL